MPPLGKANGKNKRSNPDHDPHSAFLNNHKEICKAWDKESDGNKAYNRLNRREHSLFRHCKKSRSAIIPSQKTKDKRFCCLSGSPKDFELQEKLLSQVHAGDRACERTKSINVLSIKKRHRFFQIPFNSSCCLYKDICNIRPSYRRYFKEEFCLFSFYNL